MQATEGYTSIKVRLGDAEFEASGREEVVASQYDRFLQAIEIGAISTSRHSGNGKATETNGKTEGDDDWRDPIEEMWNRAYVRDGEKVSLNVLPSGKTFNSDSIILLIYGYQSLLSRDSVKSIELLDAAQQSGLRIDRIDRNLCAEHRKLVIKGGSGKGSRYSLNNRGMKAAQELLDRLFE